MSFTIQDFLTHQHIIFWSLAGGVEYLIMVEEEEDA